VSEPSSFWRRTVFQWITVGSLLFVILTAGPSARTPQWLLIQVVGQKVIAYASFASVALMS
jgi:hypothetical protein